MATSLLAGGTACVSQTTIPRRGRQRSWRPRRAMDGTVSDPRCFDARLIWYKCGDCGASLQESQRNYHRNHEHVARPREDAMTVAEVAAVLGVDAQVVRYRMRNGKLKRHGAAATGQRAWILKADLQSYIRAVASQPEALVQWAMTGKMDMAIDGQDK